MTVLLIYLAVGAAAGTLAGLFGIGGGMVIVPVLIFMLQAQGVSPDVLVHIAVATSLASIVFTSVSSVLNHHRKGSLDWKLVWIMFSGLIVGTSLGVVVVADVPGYILENIIGVFAALLGIKMFFGLDPKQGKTLPGKPEMISAGAAIGFGSSWFGIGGGTFMVPYLNARGLNMLQSVAVAAACGFPIALTGALTNVVVGWENPLLPEWSLGFVYLPAVAGIVLTSVPFAKLGVHLAHSLDQKLLKKLFALLLMLVAIKFLAL
ncbi:MAG: sulfite exporter TauE/SafE family protein [Oceanobacter sp.]